MNEYFCFDRAFAKSSLAPSRASAVLLVLLLAAPLGCAVQPIEDGAVSQNDPVAETQEAVSGTNFGYYSCPASSPWSCGINLGSSVGRTCFLAGVWGDIASGGPSFLNVVNNGNYTLWIQQWKGGRQIGAGVVCVTGATNRLEGKSWISGNPRTPLGAGTSSRRCFLSGVGNSSGYAQFSDIGGASKDSTGNWYLGGSISGTTTQLEAVCIDVQADYGLWAYNA